MTHRSRPAFISVVVPVLNESSALPEQLHALTQQTYRDRWELLICDNGSNDGTPDVALEWQQRLPHLRVIDASDRKGLNHARNVGVENASGDYIAFCDGDDVVAPGWLEALVDAAPRADVIAGALETQQLNDPPDVVPPEAVVDGLPVKHGFLVGIPGGNCGVWTSVARDLGWDEAFTFGGSDIEFSWRAQLRGYEIGYEPNAVVHVRQRQRVGETARQWYQYGRSGGQLFRAFRDQGMPRSSVKAAVRGWGWLLVHIPDVFSTRARQLWVRRAGYRAGRVAGSVRARVIFL